MNTEIHSIIRELRSTLDGTPWYGRSVMALLNEVDLATVYKRPAPDAHSLIELLYHVNTWAGFTLKRVEKDDTMDLVAFEKLDWREIDPAIHTWENAMHEFTMLHEQLIALLQEKEDSFLDETVDYRTYDFRFLLNGLIQHTVYHLGQLAYVMKLFS